MAVQPTRLVVSVSAWEKMIGVLGGLGVGSKAAWIDCHLDNGKPLAECDWSELDATLRATLTVIYPDGVSVDGDKEAPNADAS